VDTDGWREVKAFSIFFFFRKGKSWDGRSIKNVQEKLLWFQSAFEEPRGILCIDRDREMNIKGESKDYARYAHARLELRQRWWNLFDGRTKANVNRLSKAGRI